MKAPIWTHIKVKLGDIKAWIDNPRLSTKAQAKRIIDSEKKFGQPLPFVLAPMVDGMYPLLDGHQRLAAWLTIYGENHEMGASVSNRALTDEEHKELIITLHNGATGSWDWNALASWDVGSLKEWGMDETQKKSWDNDANNLKEMHLAEDYRIDNFGDGFDMSGLPDEDRAPFQQMTFTLHDTQAEQVRQAVKLAKSKGAFDTENENSNGNALSRICEAYNGIG